MDDTIVEGTVQFVDYGADDFSRFSGDDQVITNRGNWFWIGVHVGDKNTIIALDAENFEEILSKADCTRMSQLYGRKMHINLTKQLFHVVK